MGQVSHAESSIGCHKKGIFTHGLSTAQRGSRASDDLDMIRGVAALGVFLGHARNLFFVDYHEVSDKSSQIIKALYFVTGLGHQWVMVFFVLSGFFISSSILRNAQNGSWKWSNYLINRCTRLYVVLIPALLVTLCCDRLGVIVSGNAPIYQGKGEQNTIPDVSGRSDLKTVLGNGLFLQTIFVPTLGSNGPLWSLSNEFWYYILFPCVYLLLKRDCSAWTKAVCLVLAVFIITICFNLMALFPVWLLGAILVFIPRPNLLSSSMIRTIVIMISAAAFAVTLVLSRARILFNDGLSDYSVGLMFAFLMYAILCQTNPSRKSWYSYCATGLAGMSYTLYLVHLPVLVFLYVTIKQAGRWQPDSYHLAFVLIVCVAVFLYSLILSRLTEAKVNRIRRLVSFSIFKLILGRSSG